MSVFDTVNNLVSSKEYIYSPDLESEIVPYVIATAISQHYDCIMHASEVNQRPWMSKRMVYDYFHFAIQPKKKRFAKWGTPQKDLDTLMVADYYECSIQDAQQYMRILSAEQLKEIRSLMSTGGRQ